MEFPYFNVILNEDLSRDAEAIKKTAPSIWIQEFLKLPQNLKFEIMSNRYAVRLVKEYYKSRCQHEERDNHLCENCLQTHDCYSHSILKNKIISLQDLQVKSHEWYEKSVKIMKNGEWFNATEGELEDLGPEDILSYSRHF